jgi:hypothetical protein
MRLRQRNQICDTGSYQRSPFVQSHKRAVWNSNIPGGGNGAAETRAANPLMICPANAGEHDDEHR